MELHPLLPALRDVYLHNLLYLTHIPVARVLRVRLDADSPRHLLMQFTST